MSKIVVLIETNGNWYLQDGTGKVFKADKNAVIKEVAARIGVSILTSDEVKKNPNPENTKVELDIKIAERILIVMREKFRADYSTAELDTAIVNAKKQQKNKVLPQLEKTDWDTEPISHDGIQFNKHFIELKQKLDSVETKMAELLKRVAVIEASKDRVIRAVDTFVDESITAIGSHSGDRVHRNLTHFFRYISTELKK